MRYKITNFYFNKKLKFFLLNILVFNTILTNSILSATYKMSISDISLLSTKSVEVSVYIENVGDPFTLTSYQCAFRINQELDLTNISFQYIEGSSELANKPDLDFGVYTSDGITELTFVSFIGNDVISSKTRVGTFILELNFNILDIFALDLQWDFDGSISTIITGEGFANITNPSSHVSLFPSTETNNSEKLNIIGVTASSTTDVNTSPEGVIDGKIVSDGDMNARWATQPMPATLVFDLGEKMVVNKTRFAFGNYDLGRIYQYTVRISVDMNNWVDVLTNVSSKAEEWSEESFSSVEGRYVELEFISSTNNSGQWANLWEAELWGEGSANSVEDEEDIEEVVDEEAIPSEYGMSQNYPNPFNPTTKIEVKMKENGSTRLDVYNLIGERVLAVLDTELSAGVHEVNIDGSSLASGIYIYKLSVGNQFTQIKKMNLIK